MKKDTLTLMIIAPIVGLVAMQVLGYVPQVYAPLLPWTIGYLVVLLLVHR